MLRKLQQLLADGTTLTNSTTETVLGEYVVPAGYFNVAGKSLRVKWAGSCPSTNSTDTLTLRIRIGTSATPSSNTAVFTGTATDVANNDVFGGEVVIFPRSAPSTSGTLVVHGRASNPAAAPSPIIVANKAITTADTTAAIRVQVSGTWSVASSSNQVALIAFDVWEQE